MILSDLNHVFWTCYYAIRFIFSDYDTAYTYHYCYHLDRCSFVIKKYRKFLEQNPYKISLLYNKLLFLDHDPKLELMPKGSLGSYLKEDLASKKKTGKRDLKEYRLKSIKFESENYQINGLSSDFDKDYFKIVSRRNVFMTATHDLCHILLNAGTDLLGEARVAHYQYYHLRVPGNWLNLKLSLIAMMIRGKFKDLAQYRQERESLENAADYMAFDLNELLLGSVRSARDKLLKSKGYL